MNRPIAFFLFPGFQLVDLGAMTVFDLGNSEYGGGPYDLRIVSAHGTPIRSAAGATLQTQAWRAAGHKITTIEAIGATPVGQRVQKAWAALDVPQCGYCRACHQATNSADGRVPGVKDWHLAPRSMTWQGLGKKAVCLQMRDPARNGNRKTPALSHDDFVKALVAWADAGLPCPDTP